VAAQPVAVDRLRARDQQEQRWVEEQLLYRARPLYAQRLTYGTRFTFDKEGHLFYTLASAVPD
jgi:hypothetical protein